METSIVRPPVDYPIDDRGVEPPCERERAMLSSITFAALLERHAAAQPVTDEMIIRACGNMDAAQQISAGSDSGHRVFLLSRLFKGR